MSMIAEVRTYIKEAIATVDSDLLEHEEIFVSDNIADTVIEDRYFINIGPLSSIREDTTINSLLDVSVELFKNGYSNAIENFDNIYGKAIDIQTRVMSQTRLDQSGFSKSFVSNGITPEPGIGNNNLIKIIISFTVQLSYRD